LDTINNIVLLLLEVIDMDTDFTVSAFFKFLDYLSDKNLIKFHTVRGWRSAASKLMENLSEGEELDVRTIDLDLAAHRTANRGSAVTPDSLKTYQKRVAIAINEFIKWRSDPASYKPRGLNGQYRTKTNGEREVRKEQAKTTTTPTHPTERHQKDVVLPSSGLTLSYPLRVDFLAQVVIPRDLNTIEAKRLGAFLLTIAVDYQPE
jgi:hypothetical protein